MSDPAPDQAAPPAPLDPFKLIAARGAKILAGWANESTAALRRAGLESQIDAATEARIAEYLEAYLRAELVREVARGYHDKVTVCFSTDYQPDREIREMSAALGLNVEWPWKRHLWLRVHGGASQGGEFSADQDHEQQTLRPEEGYYQGWLISPHVIPRALREVVLEAVFSGRLAPEIARWEPIGPRGKYPGEPRTCSAHGDFEPCPECKRIRDRREP